MDRPDASHCASSSSPLWNGCATGVVSVSYTHLDVYKRQILARAAGVALDAARVQVDSLVPDALAALPAEALDAALPTLDEALRLRYAEAYRNGEVLKFIARLQNGEARVGLEALPADHPLAAGAGTDNRVAIWSDRYCDQPLVIQGLSLIHI